MEECATNNASGCPGAEYISVQISHGHKKLLLFIMWRLDDSWAIVMNALEQNNLGAQYNTHQCSSST